MRVVKLIKYSIGVSMLIAAPATFAGFSTYSDTWPDDAQTVDEKISKPDASDKAVPTVTDDTEKEQYAADERLDDKNRLYAKLGLTLFSGQIRNINNVSQPALSSAIVINTNAQKDYASWEFGLGTKFKYTRLELDYFYEKNVPYNASPLFVGRSENISSKLMSQSLWLALMYDMEKLNLPYFTPYFGGLVGFVWNKTRTTMYNGIGDGVAKNHTHYSVGWGVTFGARMPFWTRWFGYLAYEYLDHGIARFQSNSGIMGLKGHYVVQGFAIGVQYLLG